MYFVLWAGDFQQGIFLFVIFATIILIVPTLLIHLNHNKYCENRTIVLLQSMIKIEGKHQITTIPINEIITITIYMSGARYSNLGTQSFPFESYFFCRIDTKLGDSYFLPSLFSDKIDKLLQERYNLDFIRERKYYPFINYNR